MVSLREERKRRFIVNCAYFAIIFLIVWLSFRYLLGWIMPFILGYFIAALVQPAVYLLHKRLRMNRRVAGVITVLLFICIFGLLLALCITKIIGELTAVAGMMPGLIENLSDAVSHLSGRISGYLDSLPVQYSEKLVASLSNVSGELMKLTTLSTGAVSLVMNIASRVPGLLLEFIVTIVAACFISMDYGSIRGFVLRQLPEKYQIWVCDIKEFFFITLAKLIRAYLTLMLITFLELSVGLSLFHVPHSIAVAAVIAIVDILPVLGTGSVMIPWAIIELLIGNIYLALCLGVLYAIITIIRNILEPKIVGYHIGLYPLVTLISMFIGLKAFGFAGMFLFPITVIILKHMQDTGKLRIWKD